MTAALVEWILVMTLVAPSASGGSSVAVVGGFATPRACQAAGDAWLRSVPAAWSKASAVCVERDGRRA